MSSILIDKLSGTIKDGPYKIQFAVNREWEKALKIDLINHVELSETEVSNFLGNEPRIIAGEVFFKTKDNKDCYIGIQWDETFTNAKTPRIFFETYLKTVILNKGTSFTNLLSQLGIAFFTNDNAFLDQTCTSIELGVVDFWMSLGPLRIYTQGDTIPTSEQIVEKVNTLSHIIENSYNYVGLEYVFENSPKHWFSFQVSNKNVENNWELEVDDVIDYVQEFKATV